MKIRRYTYGESNLVQIERARRGVMSPGQAAYLEALPYDALAGAAQNVGGAFSAVYEQKIKTQDQEDMATAELNFSMAEAARKQIAQQAEIENWSPERYEQTMDTVFAALKDSSKQISERNRGNYERNAQMQSSVWKADTTNTANGLRLTAAKNKRVEAANLAIEGKNYMLAENIVRTGMEDGTFDEIAGNEMLRKISDGETGDKLFAQYKVAAEKGSEAQFLANLANEDVPPEAFNAFNQQRGIYDAQMKGVKAEQEEQQRLQQDRALTDLGMQIEYAAIGSEDDLNNYLAAYSDANLHSIADDYKLSWAERRMLFNMRNDRLKQLAAKGNKEQGGMVEPDVGSKEYRKAISTDAYTDLGVVPDAATPEQRQQVIEWEIRNAEKYGTIGQNAVNFLNNAATGSSPGVNVEQAWEQILLAMRYYENLNAQDNVRLDGVSDEAQSIYQSMLAMDYKAQPEIARTMYVNYRSMNQLERDEAREYYKPDVLLEVIADDEDLLHKAGILRADDTLWFNEKPVITGPVRAQINRLGNMLGMFEYATRKEINYAALADKVAGVLGSQVSTSTLNKGVPTGGTAVLSSTGELESVGIIDSEAMLHAPTPPEGEIFVRGRLEEDLVRFQGQPLKVKAYNQVYTIVSPVLSGVSKTDLQQLYEAKGDVLLPMMDTAAYGLEYAEPEGNIIPVNHIRVVTPALPQDQFNAQGERIWHLYYRDKLLLNAEDVKDAKGNIILYANQPMEWTPFSKDIQDWAAAEKTLTEP